MAKYDETAPITAEDLAEFLKSEDDFAFELKVFQECRKLDRKARHGGTYTDPVTKQSRQFDIRMCITEGPSNLALAIECKNLNPCFPLMISRIPRLREEAFHQIIFVSGHDAEALTQRGNKTLYPRNAPVGKATTQVGKSAKQNGRDPLVKFVSEDSEVYNKWSQAVSSAHDLIVEGARPAEDFRVTIVIPFLVVPNNTLWVVDYAEDGQLQGRPESVDECTFFLGKDYQIITSSLPHIFTYTLTHLQVVTVNGLSAFLQGKEDLFEDIFSTDALLHR